MMATPNKANNWINCLLISPLRINSCKSGEAELLPLLLIHHVWWLILLSEIQEKERALQWECVQRRLPWPRRRALWQCGGARPIRRAQQAVPELSQQGWCWAAAGRLKARSTRLHPLWASPGMWETAIALDSEVTLAPEKNGSLSLEKFTYL